MVLGAISGLTDKVGPILFGTGRKECLKCCGGLMRLILRRGIGINGNGDTHTDRYKYQKADNKSRKRPHGRRVHVAIIYSFQAQYSINFDLNIYYPHLAKLPS